MDVNVRGELRPGCVGSYCKTLGVNGHFGYPVKTGRDCKHTKTECARHKDSHFDALLQCPVAAMA